jgi:hypothetical protein
VTLTWGDVWTWGGHRQQDSLLVWNKIPAAVAASHSVDAERFRVELAEAIGSISSRFAGREPLAHAADLVLGLVPPLETKNCWTIAEHAGHASPHGLQHLLGRAKWDADGARDDVRSYAVARLADPGAVLVVDETGDLKKGARSVGVQRQYTGTAGRVENAQVAVFLTYAAQSGHAFADRRLYLPRGWCEGADRREQAGVPGRGRVHDQAGAGRADDRGGAGCRDACMVGGRGRGLRRRPWSAACLRRRGLGYVLGIGCNRTVPTHVGSRRVDALTALVPDQAWYRHSAGDGSKGRRFYSWALVDVLAEPDGPDLGSGFHTVLARRNDTTGELAWYRCWFPRPASLAELVSIAGRRWKVEENFQSAKGLVGLDQHQVRRWDSWHRWTTLAILAHAFLTVLAAVARDLDHDPRGLIALTTNETAGCSTPSSTASRPASSRSWPPRSGDDATNTAPADLTTNDAKPQATIAIYGCSTGAQNPPTLWVGAVESGLPSVRVGHLVEPNNRADLADRSERVNC